MDINFKKECYDSNPHYKIHYSYGTVSANATMNYLHYDNDLIIEYYRKGTSSIHIEGKLYNISEGDMIILNPDELHVTTLTDATYMEKIVLHISNTLLYQFGGDSTVFFDTIAKKRKGLGNLIPAELINSLGISQKVNQCLQFAADGTLESQILLTCLITQLVAQIATLIEKSDPADLYSASSNKNANQIIDYINRHYTEEITLNTLANRFHFSKYYISHLFKDCVGVSPYDYLIIRRLYICNNLIRGKHTIKEACFLAGFNNYSNFYRLYKKHFKITPQQFKEQLK